MVAVVPVEIPTPTTLQIVAVHKTIPLVVVVTLGLMVSLLILTLITVVAEVLLRIIQIIESRDRI